MSHDASGPASGFGHAKIILLGEHAVVYGHPAVAAGIADGVRARATPGPGTLRVPAWSLDVTAGDGSKVGTALGRIADLLGARGFDVDAEAGIPPGAGLGSSAALAVAVARALGTRVAAPAESVRAAARAAEEVFHGSPSGIDQAAAETGTVGVFTRTEGWRRVTLDRRVKVCVGLTNRTRDTADLVARVAVLRRRQPVVDRLLETLGALAREGVGALETGNVDNLGRCFDMAQGVLSGLGVSSPEIETLCAGARAAGAIGAKLTGAGGGGAVIALAPSHTADVIDRWRRDGFSGFITTIDNA
jgi:mevalonate kinase